MEYEATWQSVDRHRAPGWFHDAKFGLFVHYQPARMAATGYDVTDPKPGAAAEWVDTAIDAGARYVVPVCKHGDGQLRWPSEHRAFGFGPDTADDPRDLITPLVETARRRGLKVGLYYCWATRDHPYEDQQAFVEDTSMEEREEIREEHGLIDTPAYTEYARDQVRELETLYQPDLLWFDGDGYITRSEDGVERYRMPELVSWYYNRAEEAGRDVCVNDRLGTRYLRSWKAPGEDDYVETPHGDFWTPELNVLAEASTHKWEACHTLHENWSWSRDRTVRSTEHLLAVLIDVVSKNGNLLLNVGPRPDGSIPASDRRVLSEIGDWLDVNGEAIYGTRPYAAGVDRPEPVPDVDFGDKAGTWERCREAVSADGPLRVTRNGGVAYAIHVGWPGETLQVPGVEPRESATVELLGDGGALSWRRTDDGVAIRTPGRRPCEHAYAFRIPLPLR